MRLLPLVAVSLLVGLAHGVSGQEYAPGPGEFEVRDSGEFLLRDDVRGKDLPVRVRAPEPSAEAPGPFPLIVFSHGMGGSSSAFGSLSEHLASHGYVVIHPTHADSVRLGTRAEQRQRAMELLNDPRGAASKVDLIGRVADVKLVLTALDEVEAALERPGLIDRERIGMAGHSAGALTTQALGGMRFVRRGRAIGAVLAEPRFGAFAVISGQGTTRGTLTEDSWKHVDRPWLVIAGSEDVSAASDDTPESRRHPYDYAPADGTKYLMFLAGATHSSYQGKGPGTALDGKVPDNTEWIVETTNAGVLAFFDAQVKGDEAAKAWLEGGAFAARAGEDLEFRHK